MDELARALAFLALADRRGARTVPFAYGTAVFDDRFPRRWDSNYLLVETLPDTVGAGELVEEANRLHGRAGLPHRKIEVLDRVQGRRLAPEFERLGWRVMRDLLMAHRHEPDRPVDTSVVSEVEESAVREARAELARAYPWGTEAETMRQLLDAKIAIATVVETRFFVVEADGRVVTYADLYRDGDTAQIEDVGTLEGYRGRGYASAVVMRALDEARRAGSDLVFLIADDDDWPKELYRRLGFDPIGLMYAFTLPGR